MQGQVSTGVFCSPWSHGFLRSGEEDEEEEEDLGGRGGGRGRGGGGLGEKSLESGVNETGTVMQCRRVPVCPNNRGAALRPLLIASSLRVSRKETLRKACSIR